MSVSGSGTPAVDGTVNPRMSGCPLVAPWPVRDLFRGCTCERAPYGLPFTAIVVKTRTGFIIDHVGRLGATVDFTIMSAG
jgi:hypothetical protein